MATDSGTSSLIPANNIVDQNASVGEAVTDGTVNGVTDIIQTGGVNIEDMAQKTANNAIDSLKIGDTLGSGT